MDIDNKGDREMKEIASALLKAQKEIKVAIKDSTNPHFKSAYADLPAVFDACKDALNKNGIVISQFTDVREIGVGNVVTVLVTQLIHAESGEALTSIYPLIPVRNDPQAYGSAMTYARRYCLAAIVGVVADSDDDGNKASGLEDKPLTTPPKPAGKPVWKKGG